MLARYLIYIGAAYLLSFIMCLMIYRLPREKNVIKYEEVCSECEEKVSFWRFIPLFGYIFARGKYGKCGHKMSISRLLVPILAMGIAALTVFTIKDCETFGATEMYRIIVGLFCLTMLIIVFTDFETFIIPDTCHIIVIILGILAMVFKFTSVLWGILGGVIFFVSFYLIAWIAIKKTGNENALGGGDIKMMGACGLFLGASRCLLGLLIGSFGGLLIEGLLILTKIKKNKGVAFGPYLAIGMMVAAFYGQAIIDAYTKMLGIN